MALEQEKLNQAWEILTQCARDRATITYGCLGERIDIHARNVGQQYLDPIAVHCHAVCVPDITAIVVSATTGVPSTFRHGEDVPAYQEGIYAHKWEVVKKPGI